MDEKLNKIKREVNKHIENGDFTKKDFEMFCARYNNFSDKKAVVRYDRLAEKRGVIVTDVIESVNKVLVALQNNEVIADMYKASKNN